MEPAANGWFRLDAADAAAGTLYRFRIDGETTVPDPASRAQPRDVHGPSEVVDPADFEWQDGDWRGRPWAEAVLYELNVGTFSPGADFGGVEARLDYLAELGVTALQLMPVAAFPGTRTWGYDGVLPYAADESYGGPAALKQLVEAAHARNLMVFLDVVYNHFGPEGNYLHAYAPQFFTRRHQTPWGDAINVDGAGSDVVREYFIHNALFWLEEYHIDGLRFDAVHAIADDSDPGFITELATRVRQGPGRDRHVHLVLENHDNTSHWLREETGRGPGFDAQWNDDVHHAFHVLLAGETDGYYADYAETPGRLLARCLAEGFAFQGEVSDYHDGLPRGEPSAHLPPTCFVNFLQNHDQVGNRAFGDRLNALAPADAVRAATLLLLLTPPPPMLFMGEEFAAATPFLYFCDYAGELARAVTEGRRGEFARFRRFTDPAMRERIPDPNAPATFAASALDWESLSREPHASTLTFVRELLALRREHIVPRLGRTGAKGGEAAGEWQMLADAAFLVRWTLADGAVLTAVANLSDDESRIETTFVDVPFVEEQGLLCALPAELTVSLDEGRMPPWSAAVFLTGERRR
jgi:malto-oligosyltrehalose trehalohydrolase